MGDKPNIAVVGAGISGLCTAYWLNKNGLDVTVFEKSSHIGGSIVTEKSDGFLIDLGPNSTLETSEILKELVSELGLDEQKVYGNEASNNRYIVKNGDLQSLPMSPPAFLKTKLFSTRAKLRLFREPFIKPTNGEDLSLADFVRYRLGNEFLDYAINPFVAGVYAGDPENLSTAAGFPKLHALEQKYGSLIKGAIKGARERKKRKEVAKDRARLFSFIDGMQIFPDTLARILKEKIKTSLEVRKISKTDHGFTLDMSSHGKQSSQEFDKVILSAPASSMANMLESIAPFYAKSISEINYPPVAVVFMGFKESDIKRPLDGFGFLIPEVEKRQILGCIWSSTIFPGRAPEGHVAFTSFVGGTRQPENVDLDDKALEQLVLNELNALVGLEGKPVISRIRKWPRAIPQYTVGYKNIQHKFDELESEFPGLYFSGNFRKGISVGDSVLCAHETVEKIVES
ncbi:protoporphyrinogen oxidase [Bacteroidota bacterium]